MPKNTNMEKSKEVRKMISKITVNLYIGEYSDIVGQTPEETSSRLEQIKALGIKHVLSLLSEEIEGSQIAKEAEAFKASCQGKNPTNICFHHQPVPDHENPADCLNPYQIGFKKALNEIAAILFREPNARILVHCVAAVDRSPFLIASFLCLHLGFRTLSDAYAEIKKARQSFIIEHLEWQWWTQTVEF